MKKLRLILGDQLNHQHSWYQEKDENTLYVMMEMGQELTYTTHHIQKVIAFFLAMRAFADCLEKQGHQVLYLKLDDERNQQSLTDNLSWIIEEHKIEKFEYQMPDEYRLDKQLQGYCGAIEADFEVFDTEHFMTSRTDLADFFEGKKQLLMESFYRNMRKKHKVLMDEGEPVGGKWNYDHDNRNKMPEDTFVPEPKSFQRDVTDLVELLEERGVKTIGNVDSKDFLWSVTREEGLELFDFFLNESER